MKRLYIISFLFLFLIPSLSNSQVKITGKSTGTITRTNTNAVDGKSTLEDGSNKIRVADPFYSSQTLTVNSTTPSIANYSAFKTANSSTTAITTLNGISDSTYIKVVFIRIGDIYTSFVDSDHFDCNGTNLVPSNGDLIRAVWSGLIHPNGKWLVEKLDSFTFEDMIIESGMVYDVTHPKYGAIVGDGLCDIDEIQIAADSINANSGGTLFFPPGVYSYDSDNGAIRIYSNTTLIMWGAKFDQIKGGDRLFYTDGGSDIEFIGGEIDGNAANDGDYNQFSHGISLINAFRVTVRNMYMHNLGGDGVYLADSDDCIVSNNIILQTHISDAPFIGRNGVAVVEGDNNIISDNRLEGGNPAGVDLEPNAGLFVRRTIVSNNIITEGSYGIAMYAAASLATRCDSTIVSGNLISDTEQYGILIEGGYEYQITGNTISASGRQGILVLNESSWGLISDNRIYHSGTSGEGNSSGIEIQDSISSVQIINNSVSYSERYGIWIAGTSSNENKHLVVTGNTLWNNDRSNNSTYSGIKISYTDSSYVNGNFCFDDLATHTQLYGFDISNCDMLYFGTGNFGFGNKTRLFRFSSNTKERLGGLVSYTWTVDDIAQGVGNTAMTVGGGAETEITVPFDCQVISLSISTSSAVTANYYNVNFTKNNTTTGFGDQISSGGDVRYAKITLLDDSNAGLLLVAGDRLQLIYDTHANMTPTGSLDVSATILVRY